MSPSRGSRPPCARPHGLGFLAAGYKTADGVYQEIKQLRSLTTRPFGVNLFMPQPEYPGASTGSTGAANAALPAAGAVEVYAHQLAGEAAWYETELGDPESGRDDGYDAKLAVLLDNPVAVVSFHFGIPSAEVLESLRRAGTFTLVTATTAAEARAVERAGADAVIVQGVEAAWSPGHPQGQPGERPLRHRAARADRPGPRVREPADRGRGRAHARQPDRRGPRRRCERGPAGDRVPRHARVRRARRAQAGADQPLFVRTELTRAFSGRPARGLVNRFLREHGPYAPAAYPEVHHLTSPLRKAAAKAGDAQGMALWAGQGHRLARELPAGQLVEVLVSEIAEARTALSDFQAREGGAS